MEKTAPENCSEITPPAFPWWRRLSIHTKLQSSVAGFSFLVLLICAISLTWAADTYFHKKIRQDLTMLAHVLADNLRAAVTFDDKQSAFNLLSALRENPHITVATVYKDAQHFSAYPEPGQAISHNALHFQEGIWLQDDHYFASVPIQIAGQSSAQLLLVSDLAEWKQMRDGLYLLFSGLFAGLFLLTLLLSVWLKEQITEPLGALSAWATGVSRDKDFNARAEKRSKDEIGVLVDSLNAMLSELAKQKSILSWNEQLQKEIQERKRIEKELIDMRDRAEAAFQSKSRFLANMSHEIRTPMNAIIGFINVVLDGKLNQEQRRQLETVKRSAKSLHSLLNDILDVAKLEQEKFELESVPFSTAQIVDDVIEIFSVKAKEKEIELIRNIADDVPPALRGDPFRLNQVLSNLVGNAIKFTHQGRVEIILEKANNQFLKFSIVDTGIGIPQDKQEHIFKSFGQADSSTSRRFGGSGLGTTISKQLVELMGGEIWFESRPGVGSTFSFTLKMDLADTKDLVKPDSQEPHHRLGLKPDKSLNILVAEDIVENAELLKVRLGALGHKLVHAINGEEALECFEQRDFDIILMDVHMPEVDGLAATRIIRASERGRYIPILALSASVLKEDRENCAEAGMDGFVAKPIMFEQLFSEMARVLSLKPSNVVAVDTNTGVEPLLDLPEVPGIDFEKAIRNWHDERSYVRNLRRFFSKHHNDVEIIRENLQSDDVQAARQVIHSLHGVAGNLSLETLFQALQDLSMAISQNQSKQFAVLLDGISDALVEAKESIARLCQLYDIGMDGSDILDKGRLVENIHHFEQDLARGQLDDDLLPQLLRELKISEIHQNSIDAIVKALEEFEFDQARGLLQEATLKIKADMG